MATNFAQIVESFRDLRVLVLGEAMLDCYLRGSAKRLCPEAPVPVVAVNDRSDVPGGAGNVAANVRSLGAQVTFLSVIGRDLEGELCAQALQECGVTTDGLYPHPQRQTLSKHRLLAGGQMLVRYDWGDTNPLDPDAERHLIDRLRAAFATSDAVIVSDYGYGILTPRVIAALADLQARSPRVVAVDSKHLAAYRHVGATAVKPNYAEALQLLGVSEGSITQPRADALAVLGPRILDLTGAHFAAVTLDCDGAVCFERGQPAYRTYAKPVANDRAAGAGDTFVSALALALACNADGQTAAELASSAAAITTRKHGTAPCFAHELIEGMAALGKFVADRTQLAARVAVYREQGRRIVFTNGCFDILHSGHIAYLSRAKALGDVLVVGVNSDAGIQRLKGPSRPINSLDDRLQVLSALSCIDHVIAFEEDTPCELVRALRPDVFVKGGDYTRDRLPEAALVEQLGGVVHILPYVADRSTTRILERLRQSESRPDDVPAANAAFAATGGRPAKTAEAE